MAAKVEEAKRLVEFTGSNGEIFVFEQVAFGEICFGLKDTMRWVILHMETAKALIRPMQQFSESGHCELHRVTQPEKGLYTSLEFVFSGSNSIAVFGLYNGTKVYFNQGTATKIQYCLNIFSCDGWLPDSPLGLLQAKDRVRMSYSGRYRIHMVGCDKHMVVVWHQNSLPFPEVTAAKIRQLAFPFEVEFRQEDGPAKAE